MESDLDKLRETIKRYQALLSAQTDHQAQAVLRQLIAETAAELRAREDLPSRDRGSPAT
jgi:hypothetical protein